MCMFCKHFRASECTVTLFLDIFNRARMTNRTFFLSFTVSSHIRLKSIRLPQALFLSFIKNMCIYVPAYLPIYIQTYIHASIMYVFH